MTSEKCVIAKEIINRGVNKIGELFRNTATLFGIVIIVCLVTLKIGGKFLKDQRVVRFSF